MITVTVIDMRHYDRIQDQEQSPTPYGHLSTVAAAYLLRQKGYIPQYCVTSPQSRAVRTSKMVTDTLGLTLPQAIVVPELNDLSSDPSFDIGRLKAEAKEAGVTPEHQALTAEWVKPHLFDRSNRAFHGIGTLFHKHLDDGMTVLMTSHGAAVEMRCLRMMASMREEAFLFDEAVDNINITDLPGGCFATSEGAIYRDVTIEGHGHIVNCGKVEFLRLPDEVKALKSLYPN